MINYWHCTTEQILYNLKATLQGRTSNDILNYKGNKNIIEEKRQHPLLIFFSQFTQLMTIILIVSGVVAYLVGEHIESYAIFGIVLMFGVLGFIQEYRAEKSLQLLKNLAIPYTTVKRNGTLCKILSTELIEGDIILLQYGDIVPSDVYIYKENNLNVNESILTGESIEVEKKIGVLSLETPIYKRSNMLYRGTTITNGIAEGIVVAVGKDTEIGQISDSLATIEEDETPLQKKVNKTAKIITVLGVAVGILFCTFGYIAGEKLSEMFIVFVSIVVAIIPEGLPAVIIISMAIGGRNLLKKNVLVKKLNAIEALGSVNVICTDKTGTLTEGNMKVERVSGNENIWMLANMYLNNDVQVIDGRLAGNSTEIALYEYAKNKIRCNHYENTIDDFIVEYKKPFSSLDKYSMIRFHNRKNDKNHAFIKGAFDVVVNSCSINEYDKRKYKLQRDRYTKLGMRVIACAIDNYFCGLICISDKVRNSVPKSIKEAEEAGIRVVMITGDDKFTAASVGKKIGIFVGGEDWVQTGNDVDCKNIKLITNIFARILPLQKLEIISKYKKENFVVAMTGDGINDMPALKKSDVGIAVANAANAVKETAKMILLDSNFSNIIEAIKEGRNNYENIRRFIFFSLSGNIGKTLTILIIPLLCMVSVDSILQGIIVPLMPIQLLWLNLVTDGLIGLSFGFEQPEKDIMKNKPIKLNVGIFDGIKADLVFSSLLIGILSMIVTMLYWNFGSIKWQTILFTMLAYTHIFQALTIRTKDFFYKSYNAVMLYVCGFILISQILITKFETTRRIFNVENLNGFDIVICLCVSSLMLVFDLNKIKRGDNA